MLPVLLQWQGTNLAPKFSGQIIDSVSLSKNLQLKSAEQGYAIKKEIHNLVLKIKTAQMIQGR